MLLHPSAKRSFAPAPKRQLSRELEVANRHLSVALGSMSQGLCFFDREGRLLLANERYARIYDLNPEQLRPGTSFADIVALRFAAGAGPLGTSEEQYLQWRERHHRASGPSLAVFELSNGRLVEIQSQPMPGGGWVATHEDITARRGAEQRVAHMARHDALTGLANRIYFRERLEAALAKECSGGICAVLCLDLDGFKGVNDSYGHGTGDGLLQAVATRLRHCARAEDTVTRLGGDEFAILATGLRSPAQAGEMAERAVRALSEVYRIGDVRITVGVSIGVALSPDAGTTPEDLLRKADLALYRAKADEPGSYRFFEPEMQIRQLGRLRLETELRDALERDEFEVFYQPLLDVQRGEICSFEALLRWRHPERGTVGPGEFIPVAEESGLIVPLGAWVLEQACAEAATWPEHVTISVNVSAAQFRSKSLLGSVKHALAQSGLAASRLELEVTETLLLQHTPGTLATLHALSDLGVRVSMDDFGTGHSSLSYLRCFPFDKLKIDQSFVREMGQRADALAIVRAILALGRSLDMVTTAEGVETEAQLDVLRQEGCNEVQGFLFSAPRPAAEVAHMLRSGLHCRVSPAAAA